MELDGLNMQDVRLNGFAVNAVTFYHDVIRKILEAADTTTTDKKALNRLRKVYANKLRKDDPCAVSFDSAEVRCAYLFQFCPSFTLAVASQFLAFLKGVTPEHVRKLALTEGGLAVCCLGGGPATELVSICAVLGEVRRGWAHQNGKPLLIDATIVDSEDGWSTTAEDVVTSLFHLVPQSLVKIDHFRFVRADLTRDFSKDVEEVLARSRLVTMTKFLSAIHGPRDVGARTKILQDTTSCMPVGCFLFILDSSGWSSIDAMTTTVGSLTWMESVFGPHKKTSWLSKPSRKLCFKSELYGNQRCTAKSTNKMSVWCKKSLTGCNGLLPQTEDSLT